jgi:Methyltransferase domain
VQRMRCAPFLQTLPDRFAPLRAKFDLCLLELHEADLRYGGQLIDRIVPLIRDGGKIIVSVTNRRRLANEYKFGPNIAFHSARLITSGVVPTEVYYVPTNVIRRLVRHGMFNLRILMNKGSWFSAPLAVVGGGVLFCLSIIGNLDSLRPTRRPGVRGDKSSFVMRLAVDRSAIAEDQADSPIVNTGKKEKQGEIFEKSSKTTFSDARGRSEPAYNRCIELKKTVGLASLGLTTNQVWYDDPRRLAFLLARYKFVAKMLSGSRNAGEVGCGDAFGTRIVLQEIQDVTVYDFDPLLVEDICERQDKRWPLKAEVHDIVLKPLPRKHDALFSFDVLENIAPEDERAFLSNLCESLSENGLLMIGMPPLESQPYASRPSRAGHINCKSSKQLKALLEKYFAHVFIFSMTDEVVHTGFSPMAHYVFALCAQSKWEARDTPIWEGDDVTGQRRDKSPSFQVCELKDNGTFYVVITEVDNEPRRVGNFTTAAEAARWIREQTLDWLRLDRPTSY